MICWGLASPRSPAEALGLFLYVLRHNFPLVTLSISTPLVPGPAWAEIENGLLLTGLVAAASAWWGRRRRFAWARTALAALLLAGLVGAVLVDGMGLPYHRTIGVLPYQAAPGSPADPALGQALANDLQNALTGRIIYTFQAVPVTRLPTKSLADAARQARVDVLLDGVYTAGQDDILTTLTEFYPASQKSVPAPTITRCCAPGWRQARKSRRSAPAQFGLTRTDWIPTALSSVSCASP